MPGLDWTQYAKDRGYQQHQPSTDSSVRRMLFNKYAQYSQYGQVMPISALQQCFQDQGKYVDQNQIQNWKMANSPFKDWVSYPEFENLCNQVLGNNLYGQFPSQIPQQYPNTQNPLPPPVYNINDDGDDIKKLMILKQILECKMEAEEKKSVYDDKIKERYGNVLDMCVFSLKQQATTKIDIKALKGLYIKGAFDLSENNTNGQPQSNKITSIEALVLAERVHTMQYGQNIINKWLDMQHPTEEQTEGIAKTKQNIQKNWPEIVEKHFKEREIAEYRPKNVDGNHKWMTYEFTNQSQYDEFCKIIYDDSNIEQETQE